MKTKPKEINAPVFPPGIQLRNIKIMNVDDGFIGRY